MSWVKLKIEMNGKDELLELSYTTFKQNLRVRKLADSIVLEEGGITREMPKEAFMDYLVAVISMLDIEDQKELVDTVADLIYK
jgi:hypothetical protein